MPLHFSSPVQLAVSRSGPKLPLTPPRLFSPTVFRLPAAPRSIQKGSSLADLLGPDSVDCLAHKLALAWPTFDGAGFRRAALTGLGPLGILDRGRHLSDALKKSPAALQGRHQSDARLSHTASGRDSRPRAGRVFLPAASLLGRGLRARPGAQRRARHVRGLDARAARAHAPLQRRVFHAAVSHPGTGANTRSASGVDARLRPACAPALLVGLASAPAVGRAHPGVGARPAAGIANSRGAQGQPRPLRPPQRAQPLRRNRQRPSDAGV